MIWLLIVIKTEYLLSNFEMEKRLEGAFSRHTRIAGMDWWEGPGLGLGNVRFIGVMSSTKVSHCLARFPMGYLFQNVSVNNVPSWHTC